VTILWKTLWKASTGIYELIPAFFGSALVIVIVSLLTRPVPPAARGRF
jgi:uncharacterized membrane protein YeaQ/YmgE (transglycosylase-associated protein family)